MDRKDAKTKEVHHSGAGQVPVIRSAPASTARLVHLTTEEAAALLKIRPRTLTTMRHTGSGPEYHRIGGVVRYTLEDLKAYSDSRRVKPKPRDR